MVEIAPSGGKLYIPVWKYVLFLVLFLFFCLGLALYMLNSHFGARFSWLESMRRYLSFASRFNPNLKAEDNFSDALRIHGLEAISSGRFRLFVSATTADGRPVTVLNPGELDLKMADSTGKGTQILIGRVRPMHMYTHLTNPISYSMVMDYSGSMFPSDLTAIESNFSEFSDEIEPDFSAAIIKFNTRANEITPLTSDKTEIEKGIARRVPLQNTAMYDAIDMGVEKIQGQPHLRFIVLTTDGNDNASFIDIDEAIRRCRIHNISVFVFGFGWLNVDTLRKLADETDGYYSYVTDSSGLGDWFKKLGQIINNVQVIEFSTSPDFTMPSTIELTINTPSGKITRTRSW